MNGNVVCSSLGLVLVASLIFEASSQQDLFRESSFMAMRRPSDLVGGPGMFGDFGPRSRSNSRADRSRQLPTQARSYFPELTRGTGREFYSRPISGSNRYQSPHKGSARREMSAFKNLFGQDIGQPVGIYDDFGKPKSNNLANILAQPLHRNSKLRLDEVKQEPTIDNMQRYARHPFSSIRLSPVTQIPGTMIQSPVNERSSPFDSYSQSESLEEKGRKLLAQNRARNFHPDDPFEKPLSSPSFGLSRVDEPITLTLSRDIKPEARSLRFPKGQTTPTGAREANDGSGSGRLSSSSPESSLTLPKEQPVTFKWSKPVSGFEVESNDEPEVESEQGNTQSIKSENGASLKNVSPGDALRFPSTVKLELPSIPSAHKKPNAPKRNNDTLNKDLHDGKSILKEMTTQTNSFSKPVGNSSFKITSKYAPGVQGNSPNSFEEGEHHPWTKIPETLKNSDEEFDVTVPISETPDKKSGNLAPNENLKASPSGDFQTNVGKTIHADVKNGKPHKSDSDTFILPNGQRQAEKGAVDQSIREENGRLSNGDLSLGGNGEEKLDGSLQNSYDIHQTVASNSRKNVGHEGEVWNTESGQEFPDKNYRTNPSQVEENTPPANDFQGVKPPVGSGYLLSDSPHYYQEDSFPPPAPTLQAPPLDESFLDVTKKKDNFVTNTDLTLASGRNSMTYPSGGHEVGEVDDFRKEIEKSEYSNDIEQNGPIMGNDGFLTDATETKDPSSDTVVIEENIDLDHAKEIDLQRKQQKRVSSYPSHEGRHDKHGLNDFSDYNFEQFASPPFEDETFNPKDKDEDESLGHNSETTISNNNKHVEPHTSSFKTGKPAESFSINTDPGLLNFDVFKAGEGVVDIHRKYDSSEADNVGDLPSLELPPSESAERSSDSIEDVSRDQGNFGKSDDLKQNSNDAKGLPVNFIDAGFDDIQKSMGNAKHSDARWQNFDERPTASADVTSDIRLGEQDPSNVFATDFPDYDSYYSDPNHYKDDKDREERLQLTQPVDADVDHTKPGYETDPTATTFLASPFEAMFGKPVDRDQSDSFGSLFQTLGQSQHSRASRENNRRGLFDDRLGQIIKTRPSLNLLGR